jgi:hypothetical protein
MSSFEAARLCGAAQGASNELREINTSMNCMTGCRANDSPA